MTAVISPGIAEEFIFSIYTERAMYMQVCMHRLLSSSFVSCLIVQF